MTKPNLNSRTYVQGRLARFASIYSGSATKVIFEGNKVCTNQKGTITLPSEMHLLPPHLEVKAMAFVAHEMGHDFVHHGLNRIVASGETNRNSKALTKAIISKRPELKALLISPSSKAKLDGFNLFNKGCEAVGVKLAKAALVRALPVIAGLESGSVFTEPAKIIEMTASRLTSSMYSSYRRWARDEGKEMKEYSQPFRDALYKEALNALRAYALPSRSETVMIASEGRSIKTYPMGEYFSKINRSNVGSFRSDTYHSNRLIENVTSEITYGLDCTDSSYRASCFAKVGLSLRAYCIAIEKSLMKGFTDSFGGTLGGKVRNMLNAVEDPRQEAQTMSRLVGTTDWFKSASDEAFARWGVRMENSAAVVSSETLTGIACLFYLESNRCSEYLSDEIKEMLDIYRSESFGAGHRGMLDAFNLAVFIVSELFSFSDVEAAILYLNEDVETEPETEGDTETEDETEGETEGGSEGEDDSETEEDSEDGEGSEDEGEEDPEGGEGSEDEAEEDDESEDGSEGGDSDSDPEPEDGSEEEGEADEEMSTSSDAGNEGEALSLKGQFVRLEDGRLAKVITEDENGNLEVVAL